MDSNRRYIVVNASCSLFLMTSQAGTKTATRKVSGCVKACQIRLHFGLEIKWDIPGFHPKKATTMTKRSYFDQIMFSS